MRKLLGGITAWLPHAIIAIDVAVMLALAVQLYNGRPIVNNAIDIWFDRSDPTLDTLNQERRLFGHDTWMLATVWMRPERVGEASEVARALTEALERIDGVTRVISPTSLEVLQRDAQGLFYDELDAQAWQPLRDTLLRHPFAGDFLVYSKSPELFSLLIKEHTGPTTPGIVRQRLVSEVRRVLDTHPAVAAAAVAGTAVINADLNRLSWRDFMVLVPTTVVVACVMLLAMLRFRWRTCLAILAPVGLTTGALIAAMLLSGRPFTMVTIALPGLSFTLGVASCLHVTGWIAAWLREGRGTPAEATQATFHQLIRPILVSQITTALGFGLLAVIPVTPVQEMALFGAAGELLSGVHVVFVLPMCLLWFGAMKELADDRTLFVGERWTTGVLGALAAWLTRLQRYRVRLAIATVAVCLVMGWLTSRVRYDSTYIHMIQANERLRIDYARFDAAALPSAQLSIVITKGNSAPVVDAALNTAIGAASAEIEALPEVSKVIGPASIFAEVAPALAGDQPAATFAADDSSVTDAYIFALSGGNTEIPSYVHDGLGAYRLVVFFPYLDNSKLEQLTRQEIPAILKTHLGGMADVSARVSGVTVLWANMDDTMSRGQIASVLVMAIACFFTFFLSLRNWTLAACAMFVNVVPVAVMSAFLGATGHPIDMATVFIMGISLGIAVDDTSFYIHEYLDRSRLGAGALASALRHTGPTMIATCVVIVIGFSVLLLSAFIPMRTFGGLTAVGLVLAMLCDIFILSFLLLAFSSKANGLQYADDTVARTGAVHAHGGAGS
ncbi:MAG TPA: MMPL family transporter [Vicinamibacterales bacterium]